MSGLRNASANPSPPQLLIPHGQSNPKTLIPMRAGSNQDRLLSSFNSHGIQVRVSLEALTWLKVQAVPRLPLSLSPITEPASFFLDLANIPLLASPFLPAPAPAQAALSEGV
jgi:hypothetical protein